MNTTVSKRTHAARLTMLGASFILGLSVLSADSRSIQGRVHSETAESSSAQPQVSLAELPLSFEPNLGQADRWVKFLSRGNGYKLLLTNDKAVLLLDKSNANPEIRKATLGEKQPDGSLGSMVFLRSSLREQEQPADQAVVAMRLLGANRRAATIGLAPLPGTSNYFIGNDPTNWHTHVPNYAKVRYENVYRGVDLVYYGNHSHLEYDFVVAPGGDPRRINLALEAQGQAQAKIHRPKLDDNGDLVIDVDGQEIRFRKPFVYQLTSESGVQTPIAGRYVLRANNHIGFEVGRYDHSKPLVIDPVLLYSTYLGGNGYDQGFGVAVDGSGNIVIVGTTASTNFPTKNAFLSQNAGDSDVFVTKFNPSGTSLIYSTYLGGHLNDNCEALALDSSGNAYLTGFTSSGSFPTKNAVQATRKGPQNIFLSKLDPSGNLLASTYYGGSAYDEAFGIAVDSTGVYVVGNTNSSNYPTKNAFQPQIAGSDDAFLTKFTTDGASVVYSTYLGGAGGGTQAYSVAVDSSQSPYMTGQTTTLSFPLMNPYQNQNKTGAAGTVFVTKFAPTGNALVYSTYLGGSNIESAGSIAVDSSGSAYVAGGTASSDFPTQNAFQAKYAGAYDAFVTKFNSSGDALVYSTFVGGSSNEFGDAITVDSAGNAYVAGYTFSVDFPTTLNAFQRATGGSWDGFVLELNSAGSGLIFSSYLGGSGNDVSDAIALDSSGNIYLTGDEASTNFPITNNAFQSSYGGGSFDAYLAVVSATPTFPLTVSTAGTGVGTVISTPMGISCGPVCSTTFASGTVTLTAIAGAGSTFTGWSGACSGIGVCNVTLSAARSVTATFGLPDFAVLGNFGTDGGAAVNPTWPGIIAQGRDGNLYSTTPGVVAGSNGAVFNVTPSGIVTVLTTFASGGAPQSGLILGMDGEFYGTTFGCSVGSDGSIFKVTAGGTISTLYDFTGGLDGKCPTAPPIQGSDGNFYGTATSSNTSGVYGSVYKLTASGTFTTLRDFANNDGAVPDAPLVQANNGVLYGVTQAGDANNTGEVFSITTSGAFSIPSAFNGTDGQDSVAPLVQGTDGNFYGTTIKGGTNNLGVVFKITPTGTITVLHNFAGTGDGVFPYGGLLLASDGNFYGTTSQATASSGCGTIFRISSGYFATVYTFNGDGSFGCNPQSALVQHTNGMLYGDTSAGGSTIGGVCASGCGTFFSLNANLQPFVSLSPSSARVGTKVYILGQGFSSSSVVKFNGVPATALTVTGTTFITATVPPGASTGFVTVTTGSTTLSSRAPYVVHNSWSSGTAMPVGVAAPAVGVVNGSIYVVGGFQTNGGAPVSNNQVYNLTANTWTTAAAIPTPVFGAASAVVGNSLYVIGGYEGSSATPTNLVQIYNSKTNVWSTTSAMPTARGSATAVLDGNAIYVIGGNGSTSDLSTVEKYVPSTNTWTEEAPLLTGKSALSAALLGTTIVAADGTTASGDTGDNEAYNVSTNTWSSLTADPNPRNASCSSQVSGLLYAAGGLNNGTPQTATTANESFNLTQNKWTSVAAMPTAALWQGSAGNNGILYCFGGQASNQGAVLNNVQIYQP